MNTECRKRVLFVIVSILVFATVLMTSGCANTATGFGHLLKATGSATSSLGNGVGKLLDGAGEDFIDASSKQRANRQDNQR